MATTIDNSTVTDSVRPLGELTSTYYAETFIAAGNVLNNVTISSIQNASGGATNFHLLITNNAGSGGNFRPGTVLFESGTQTVAPGQTSSVSIDTGNLSLTPGTQYAFILDTYVTRDGVNDSANVGTNNSYANGAFFFSNDGNGRASAFASNFNNGLSSRDISFRQTYDSATSPAPCYCTGTGIRVLRGRTVADVPVERLRVGDLALTASGKPRPIRWIGTRSYPGLTAPKHDRPVRIRAGALCDGVPARDLLVSPDHCLWLDGLLVAAGHLVNGTSIVRGEAVRDLTYWHVELDSHDLLMAENTPAESFLAAPGVRAGFDGTAVPDAAVAPVAYAPRAERHTPEMVALRERLILRAGLSIEPMRFGAVRAWLDVCDGVRVAGWAVDGAHPDGPVCLDILVDGAIVALALAQDHRADLAAAGMGDGRHGFDIALDAPLPAGIAHTVEVRRSADGLRVAAMAVDAAGAWTALLAA